MSYIMETRRKIDNRASRRAAAEFFSAQISNPHTHRDFTVR